MLQTTEGNSCWVGDPRHCQDRVKRSPSSHDQTRESSTTCTSQLTRLGTSESEFLDHACYDTAREQPSAAITNVLKPSLENSHQSCTVPSMSECVCKLDMLNAVTSCPICWILWLNFASVASISMSCYRTQQAMSDCQSPLVAHSHA